MDPLQQATIDLMNANMTNQPDIVKDALTSILINTVNGVATDTTDTSSQ